MRVIKVHVTIVSIIAISLCLGIVLVNAFGTTNPPVLGHSLGEIAPGTFSSGNYIFPNNLTVLGRTNLSGNVYAGNNNLAIGQVFTGTTGTQQTGGTVTYFPIAGSTSSSTNLNTQQLMPVAGRFSTLRCNLPVAPGGAASRTIHFRLNGANSGLTCTVSGASTTCNDLVNTVTISAGDVVNFQQTPASSPASSRVRCAVVFRPS